LCAQLVRGLVRRCTVPGLSPSWLRSLVILIGWW
jgi:hypothetical protein